MTNSREYQREASRKWYAANKDVQLARAKDRRQRRMNYVRGLKASTACTDCEHFFPYYVMDFDHLDGSAKIGNIAHIVARGSMKQLLAEIAKCELVCANCHRIRTFARMAAAQAMDG